MSLASIAAALGWRRPAPRVLVCDGALWLTPRHSLHLVRCGARQWLIACHPGGATVVDEVGAAQQRRSGGGREAAAC